MKIIFSPVVGGGGGVVKHPWFISYQVNLQMEDHLKSVDNPFNNIKLNLDVYCVLLWFKSSLWSVLCIIRIVLHRSCLMLTVNINYIMNNNKVKFSQKLNVFFKKDDNEIRGGGRERPSIRNFLRKNGGGIMTILSRHFLK